MGALLGKVAEIGFKPLSEISNAVVGVQVDMLVLHRAPESFDKDVVHPPSFSVHADRNVVRLQDAGELLAGELSALVGVKDLRPAVFCNGFFQSVGAKVRGHGVRQPPRQDFARGPVHHRHQVGKALGHGDVSDVCKDPLNFCSGHTFGRKIL